MNNLNDNEEFELNKMQKLSMGDEYELPYENDRCIAEEEDALRMLDEKTVKNIKENRYQVPLLWNVDDPILPTESSLYLAEKRLKLLIQHAKRLGKFNEIIDQIQNLIDKSYGRKLPLYEVKKSSKKAFYIPIFISEQKGKRIRLIWDAAAKVQGKSLNDYLLSGPNLYSDLVSLFMQLREGEYFVKADVSEMFHQIQIIPEDRPALRFLFVDKETNEIVHYEMNVMIFGAVCAPSTSQYIKNKIADEYEDKYPEEAKVIKRNIYVDDLVKSFNDLEAGKKLIKNVRDILKSGGFDLVKLKGNHPNILDAIKSSLTAEELNDAKVFSQEIKEKILGYIINYETDSFSLAIKPRDVKKEIMEGTKIPSKKELLRFLMSIYDPLGFFSFYLSKIKLLYHWTCKEEIDWNELINEKHYSYWHKILAWFPEICKIEIPRCYSKLINRAHIKQLLMFCDAGKEMMCNVAFIRILDENGKQIDYKFIASKTYTVPLRQNRTIPELELDAAKRSIKFKKQITASHTISFDEVFYLTDSSCVYYWIKNDANRPTRYTKNRLDFIKKESKAGEWLWIPTELQAADFGTKFESMPSIKYDSEWYNPKIFSIPQNSWFKIEPDMQVMNVLIEELEDRKNDCLRKFMYKFSSWNKLRKMTSILIKVIRLLKIKTLQKKPDNGSKEQLKIMLHDYNFDNISNAAESAIFKFIQNQEMVHEIQELEQRQKLPIKNNLHKFSPFLDDNGVMRVRTRLPENNEFNYNRRFPIVLPKNNKVTELIIMQYHINNQHVFHNSVIANLKHKYFIPNINWTVTRIIRQSCFKCKRENAKPDTPMMGDLPSSRLAIHENPFSYIIVDTCGSFSIRVNRKTEKRWLFVASCLTTRGIFISVLHSMSSESCLMALENLINTKGAPKRIISDNGSNFVGGNNKLTEKTDEWNQKLLDKNIISEAIEWDFNPAKASSMNGSIERLIGMVKKVLHKMHDSLDKRLIVPNDETFTCMIKEVEGLINNRPLSMIPLEGTTDKYLTPNHFIMLRSNFQAVPQSTSYKKCYIKNWEDVKEFIGSLWGHFQKFYINELLYREKWFDKTKKLEVGEIVVTADPTIPNLWRLGVIIDVVEGSKDQIRKVTVKLGKRNKINESSSKTSASIKRCYVNEKYSIITRPATQVAALELKTSY